MFFISLIVWSADIFRIYAKYKYIFPHACLTSLSNIHSWVYARKYSSIANIKYICVYTRAVYNKDSSFFRRVCAVKCAGAAVNLRASNNARIPCEFMCKKYVLAGVFLCGAVKGTSYGSPAYVPVMYVAYFIRGWFYDAYTILFSIYYSMCLCIVWRRNSTIFFLS